jgi:hypothetical protein
MHTTKLCRSVVFSNAALKQNKPLRQCSGLFELYELTRVSPERIRRWCVPGR